jgi:subtilisin family serine protease
MRVFGFGLLVLGLLATAPCVLLAAPSAAPGTDCIVRFREGVTRAERDDWLQGVHGQVLHEFSTGDAVAVRLPAATAPDLATMGKDRRIAHVEGDATGIPDLVPNDPLYTSQPQFRDPQHLDLDIQAESAWDLQHDAPTVTVAVIDDGFLLTHPDLAGRFVAGYDCGNNDNDPSPDNDGAYYAHGTGVTGLLAATGNNGVGVTGVCWDVRVMPLKHHNDYSSGYSSSVATTAAVDRAVAAGVDIIVCSFHYLPAGLDVTPSGQFYRSFRAASDAGIIIVASAGNDAKDLDDPANARYPASFDFPNLVTVAMTGSRGVVMAAASSYGNETVEMSAPGVALMSTWIDTNHLATYAPISGTSASTPLVAGGIALLKAAHPELDYPAGVLARLYERSETPAGNEAFVSGGRRLNLYRLLADADPVAPDPVGGLSVVSATGTSVTVGWTEPGDDGSVGMLDHFLMSYVIVNESRTDVGGLPATAGLGTPHSCTVGGLPFGSQVDVSVIAVDDYRNRTAATITVSLPAPVLVPANTSAFVMARTGAARDSTIVLRNIGTAAVELTPYRASGGDWLQFSTDPFTIAPGDSVAFPFSCRPSALCGGFYTGGIGFANLKPLVYPVSLLVIDAPAGQVTPAALDLGLVAGDATVSTTLALANPGCAPLHWSAAPSSGAHTITPAAGTLMPGTSVTLDVAVQAGGAQPLDIVVTTDDPFDGTFTVPVAWQPGSPASAPGNDGAPVWSAQPNPFNPRTMINYTLPRAGDAGLLIFDVRGALVRALPLGMSGPGNGVATWDGCDDAGRVVPSGAYFCRLVMDGEDLYRALRLQLVR